MALIAGFPAGFWACLIGSLAQRGVIFHITAHPLPDMSKMDKINIHRATKTRAPQNQCHLFDGRLFPQARAECARILLQCELAALHSDSCIWNKCPVGHPRRLPILLLSAAPQGTAGWVTGASQNDCDKGSRIKFPDSYLNKPPLILPCHTHKEITEWI